MQGVEHDEDTSLLTVIDYNDALLTVVKVDFSQGLTSLSLISVPKGIPEFNTYCRCIILFCTLQVEDHIFVYPTHKYTL